MSSRLTVFVSSTVRDFGPVRRDIKQWLRGRRVDVRESEDPEFPVDPAVHSHDACLRAIEGCHVFILLIGWRFGGLYKGSQQSITWREYDEATQNKIPVVALVLKEVADESMRVAQQKRALGLQASRLDPGVQRFLDALRKGHKDNWIHLDWDGSFTHARRCIESRMNTLYVNYLRPHRELESLAERFPTYVTDRSAIEETALQLRHRVAAGADEGERAELLGQLLAIVASLRSSLFGFGEDDIYDFVVHRRRGAELAVFARRHDPSISPHNRAWEVGEGYVGRAAESSENIIVSENLQQWTDWRSEYSTDEVYYRSAVCIPVTKLSDPLGAVTAVLTITSNRIGHFKSSKDLEALTARSLASIISLTGVLDG